MDWHQYVGILGTTIYITNYASLQAGKVDGNGLVYVSLNLAASSFVLFSLLYAFNLASALIQTSWIVISLAGLLRKAVVARVGTTGAPYQVLIKSDLV